MFKLIGILITSVIFSFYFFPFEFTFLPAGLNTKMLLAGCSLPVLAYNLIRDGRGELDSGFLKLSVIALLVSLMSYAAVAVNSTNDFTYVSYIVSMWVWLGGAYIVAQLVKAVHGRFTVTLLCHYLIGVCVAQCLIAYAMDVNAPLKSFVDSFLAGTGFMGKSEDRLYGIGASLDVAGMRFSVALVMAVYLMTTRCVGENALRDWFCLLSYLVIIVLGSMIARTTYIGVIFSLLYAAYRGLTAGGGTLVPMLHKAVLLGCLFTPFLIWFYHANVPFHENIRFAFEGFFSLVEKGRWEVHSNDILQNMYVLPDNLKTWLVGDGYMENPYGDPYYTGPRYGGFYMGTDIGYLRFIFYFGLPGLLLFIYYMYSCARICMRRLPACRDLLVAILLINYVVWCKVSSGLFVVFALFLCLPSEEADEEEAPLTIPQA